VCMSRCKELGIPWSGNKEPLLLRIVAKEFKDDDDDDDGATDGLTEKEQIILINAVHTHEAYKVSQHKGQHSVSPTCIIVEHSKLLVHCRVQKRWQAVQSALATSPEGRLWSIEVLRAKWNSLFHRFRRAQDRVKQSGAASSHFKYYTVMRELFITDARVQPEVQFRTSEDTAESVTDITDVASTSTSDTNLKKRSTGIIQETQMLLIS
jgi:hypothetical protein